MAVPMTSYVHKYRWAVKKYLLIAAAIAALSSYYVYKQLNNVPALPKVDQKQFWGPYPMKANPDVSVRPYEIEFTDVMINDLRERLLHRRPFTPPLEDTGSTYGFNTHFLTQVLDYWQNKYHFKDRERFFNKYPQFKTNVQGLDIHFMHVKPQVEANVTVVPLLLLHGWPGSFRQFYEVIPKLTTQRPNYDFVFEVIAPSLPGYGYSQAASRPGLGSVEVAVLMNNLMQRLGHTKYYVQGGGWGHRVAANMATLYADNVMGFHTNTPVVLHKMAAVWTVLGSFWPSMVVEKELQDRMYPIQDHMAFLLEEMGYLHLQATKPDTIGAALTDSPAGLAAYILEKLSTWTDRRHRRAADGKLLAKFSLTHLLDNIMVYWATNSITTSMRMYAETLNKRNFELQMDQIPTPVPTWGLKTKHELMYQPDSFLKLKYTNYLHSTVAEDGGHFVAMEAPDLMADDLFHAVDTFILFHSDAGKPQKPATSQQETNYETAKTIYEFTVKDAYGRDVKLDKYKGHVLIVVNVASQCGLTDTNYKQLDELHEKYSHNRGLKILAFPCNQFGYQEPGSIEEIIRFTKDKGIKFDLFSKIEVNGESAHPLWKFLKKSQSGTVGDFIKWNFTKFIIDKNGVPVARFGPTDEPISMEPHLAKYW